MFVRQLSHKIIFSKKKFDVRLVMFSVAGKFSNHLFACLLLTVLTGDHILQVRSQTSIVDMVPENLQASMFSPKKGSEDRHWNIFMEKAGVWGQPDFVRKGFVDHINTTKDSTDYLWYTTSMHVDESEEFLSGRSDPILVVESKGHAVHAFVNQKLQATASGNGSDSTFKLETPISLRAGKNEIALLSMTVGLQVSIFLLALSSVDLYNSYHDHLELTSINLVTM
ncbi:beta-galactosidase 10-like [Elaeis guineensis]|uniref:beta-galactosidase 10-like n=1 Tax=Elaeis guineensis var. tenera TaxID=51953 RepID=UPI003C6D9411